MRIILPSLYTHFAVVQPCRVTFFVMFPQPLFHQCNPEHHLVLPGGLLVHWLCSGDILSRLAIPFLPLSSGAVPDGII